MEEHDKGKYGRGLRPLFGEIRRPVEQHDDPDEEDAFSDSGFFELTRPNSLRSSRNKPVVDMKATQPYELA